MYNFVLAFVICAVAYLLGEVLSNLTKAWIPSVFVTAVLMLVGYWTILPTTVVSDANLIPFGSTVVIYLLIAHMGTVISPRQLAEQWKTVAVCLVGLLGMCAASLLAMKLGVIRRDYIISGLPALTGGLVAATTMQTAALEKGLADVALFAIAMYCVQGFAGYPLTALCLQFEGKKLSRAFRSGAAAGAGARTAVDSVNGKLLTDATARKKLLPPIPDKWNGPVTILLKLAIVAWIGTQLGRISFWGFHLSGVVWALVLGVLGTAIGFLDENAMTKANSYGIAMFALMMYIFDGLSTATPAMLSAIIGPMLLLIVVGVAGMALSIWVVARLLKTDYAIALASALTALYGFPPNAIITENTCSAIAQSDAEKEYLMENMFPPMIVGGFVTVTITSVIIAGVFAGLL